MVKKGLYEVCLQDQQEVGYFYILQTTSSRIVELIKIKNNSIS